MNFIKMHGLGNDFVIVDQRGGLDALTLSRIQEITNRNTGVGCDQFIVMEPSESADLFMRIYNPDGSQAEACGNATRCVAHIYMSEQGVQTCVIETLRGLLECRMVGELVEVDMGAPMSIQTLPVNLIDAYEPILVNMGNPHCVMFVDNAEEVALEYLGPSLEKHEFFPEGTNVEFAHLQADGSLRVRVWERGAGITLACGSGACAVAVAAIQAGITPRSVDIEMDGGRLSIAQREDDGHVLMTGPVAYVFEGQLRG